MRIFGAIAIAVTMATGANAATLATGGTGSAGAGGFTFQDGSSTTDWGAGQPGVWTTAPMIEDAFWILDGPGPSSVYKFVFDLTGQDLSTVSLMIDWAVDNSGSVDLNGSQIDSIASGSAAYSTIHSVIVSEPGAFNAGENTLLFNQTGDQRTDGLRAAVRVTGELAPVPLPAGGALLFAGLGAMATVRKRRNT